MATPAPLIAACRTSGIEFELRAARRIDLRDPRGAQPQPPVVDVVERVQQGVPREIGRLAQRLRPLQQARAADRQQRGLNRRSRQARPVAGAVANAAVDAFAGEVDQPRGRDQADLELRPQRLKAAEPSGQPARGKRGRGADRERAAAGSAATRRTPAGSRSNASRTAGSSSWP